MFIKGYFTAHEALVNCIPNATEYAFNKISEAIGEGRTRCYVDVNQNRIPIETAKELIRNGFDIQLHHFERDDSWYVQADWSDTACGRIVYQKSSDDAQEISFEKLVSILKNGNRNGYVIEEINDEEKNKLLEQNIKYEETSINSIVVENFDVFIEALITIGRFTPEF